MTTRYRIAEQVMRIVSGGDVSNDNSMDIREVMLLVDQERDSLIKAEIMDWTYTKSTATSKGELEINGAWLTSRSIPLFQDYDHLNGIVYASLSDEDGPTGDGDNTVVGYVSLPNDMGMYRVASSPGIFKKKTKVFNISGNIRDVTYNRDAVDIVFNLGPKVLDSSYQVSFDFTIGTTLLANGVNSQNQYGGVKTHKITFNVDIENNDGFENTHLNFVKAMVNSPGFKKFVKDFDIRYGVTESTPDGNQDNFLYDGAVLFMLYFTKIRLSTNYGANISNFTINGTGPRYQNANGNEGGGANEFGTQAEADIGLGWSITNDPTGTGQQSEDSADSQITGNENSHGVGFIINDTMYTTEFISPDVTVTSDDLILNFLINNAEKIAKEQNVAVTRIDTNTSTGVDVNPNPLYGLSFQEIEARGGFDIDVITPGNAFSVLPNSDLSVDESKITENYKPIVYTRMPSGGDYNSLYNKTVRKSGRKFYYIDTYLNKPRLYFYNQYSMDALTSKSVNITYIATSESFGDNDPYPIPADYEKIIIKNLVEIFAVMRKAADDMSNDNIK